MMHVVIIMYFAQKVCLCDNIAFVVPTLFVKIYNYAFEIKLTLRDARLENNTPNLW